MAIPQLQPSSGTYQRASAPARFAIWGEEPVRVDGEGIAWGLDFGDHAVVHTVDASVLVGAGVLQRVVRAAGRGLVFERVALAWGAERVVVVGLLGLPCRGYQVGDAAEPVVGIDVGAGGGIEQG